MHLIWSCDATGDVTGWCPWPFDVQQFPRKTDQRHYVWPISVAYVMTQINTGDVRPGKLSHTKILRISLALNVTSWPSVFHVVLVWIWRQNLCVAAAMLSPATTQPWQPALPNMESLKVVWNVRGCDTFFEGLFGHSFWTGGLQGKANQVTQKRILGSTTLKNQDFQNCIP